MTSQMADGCGALELIGSRGGTVEQYICAGRIYFRRRVASPLTRRDDVPIARFAEPPKWKFPFGI